MRCEEEVRLRQLFELSVRRLEEVQATCELFVPQTVKAETMLKTALAERAVARERWTLHRTNCEICQRRLTQSEVSNLLSIAREAGKLMKPR